MFEHPNAQKYLPAVMDHASQQVKRSVLVLSLGNPLRGDDGIGSEVLKSLSTDRRLPQDIFLLDGYRGGLVGALLGGHYDRVIIVDAALLGCPPGTWKRLTLSDVNLAPTDLTACHSLHNASLVETLALAESLDIPLPEIIIYGVQPWQIVYSLALSDPLQSVIAEICTAILKDLEDHGGEQSQDMDYESNKPSSGAAPHTGGKQALRTMPWRPDYLKRKEKYHGEDTCNRR